MGDAYIWEWSSFGERGTGLEADCWAGGVEAWGGICRERPRIGNPARCGVVGGTTATGAGVGAGAMKEPESLIELSSLEALLAASMMCGEGESFWGVPPPSDKERVVFPRGVLSMSLPLGIAGSYTSSPTSMTATSS